MKKRLCFKKLYFRLFHLLKLVLNFVCLCTHTGVHKYINRHWIPWSWNLGSCELVTWVLGTELTAEGSLSPVPSPYPTSTPCFVCYCDRVSHNSGWPKIHYAAEAGPSDLPALLPKGGNVGLYPYLAMFGYFLKWSHTCSPG